MIVQKPSVFPAGRDTVFQKLRQLSTLQTVAAPFATFEPVKDAATIWQVGGTSAYSFRLFGCIPFDTHTIHIVRFGSDSISSRKRYGHVPAWNLGIKLRPLDNGRTEYTDRVENGLRLAVGRGVLCPSAEKVGQASPTVGTPIIVR